MKSERPSREQLIELAKTDPEAIADLVLMLWDRVEALEAKVAELERNSRNSSKPPSSDQGNFSDPPKPKSLRKKTNRKPGGQKGHKGSHLKQVNEPDFIEVNQLDPDALCPDCQHPVAESVKSSSVEWEKRQVFDLPPIRIEVTEHRSEKCACSGCGKVLSAAFPEGVNAPTQYGPNLQGAALYLGGYQLIPYQRLSELFADLFTCPLSPGTLANFVKRGGQKAHQATKPIKEALLQAKLLHSDETGCRVHGKRHWLHVACTRWLSYFHIDTKRGYEAIARMGILESFTGRVVHDFYSSYYKLKDCAHFLCNAHLLRDLTYVHEQLGQDWAKDMIALLLEAKKLRDREDQNQSENQRDPTGKTKRKVIGEKTRDRIQNRYMEIVLAGYKLNPEPEPIPGKRGRPKRGKALNLLHRLEKHYEEVMGFFEYEGVPFDNNQAERDLRMMKTREKISGTFRSNEHAKAFCDIRSVLSCARKQSRNILTTMADLIRNPTELGQVLVKRA